MNRERFVHVVGINQRRSSAAPAGRREATCFSKCGQSPSEITATSVTASNSARVEAISSDSCSLLSESDPAQSKAIYHFLQPSPPVRGERTIVDRDKMVERGEYQGGI